ncbi:hypothetical protein ACFQY4_23320 [Catellatospora bangladeshensis]|uniref:lipase/acyltransferase domain-containing protein n=1 Tax=Catellatospora bangladeshensis TaxID=310355 RepID=UPI0036087CA1
MRDAVMVIPGIMGSELVDERTDSVVWGMADVRWYADAWLGGDGLLPLMPGRAPVRATRLLRAPAFAPFLRGVEPYTELLAALRQVCADPAAVAEFPYDWRLAVSVNAQGLAQAAVRHLERWRRHRLGDPQARLVLVAHSMGGLVARWFTELLGGSEITRSVITIGTPFFGAVAATKMINSGLGTPVPLPHRRVRELAVALPGLYDLLPGTGVCAPQGLRRLEPVDVADFGGDLDLAKAALPFSAEADRLLGRPGLRAVVGVDQPTAQSLEIVEGVVTVHDFLAGAENRAGDGTVYRDAAAPPGVEPTYVSQGHGALARTAEVIAHVRAVLTESPLGPPLGAEGVGVEVPDVVQVGEQFDVVAVNRSDPARVTCRVVDAGTGASVARPVFVAAGGATVAYVRLPARGLYRVEVKSGGASAVRQLVLATS